MISSTLLTEQIGWISGLIGNILYFCIAVSFLAFYFAIILDLQVNYENSTGLPYTYSYPAFLNIS